MTHRHDPIEWYERILGLLCNCFFLAHSQNGRWRKIALNTLKYMNSQTYEAMKVNCRRHTHRNATSEYLHTHTTDKITHMNDDSWCNNAISGPISRCFIHSIRFYDLDILKKNQLNFLRFFYFINIIFKPKLSRN